ncbi:MAG: hypothetical protein RL662_538 [Bacteroidota bacterium]|jgi:hypothetical protein
MKSTKIIVLLFLICLPYSSYSQIDEIFKPSGRIIARSFFDFSQGFGEANNETGFDITRAFIGYNYKISKTLQAQVILDGASGHTASGNLQPYLRNAFINWTDKGFNVSVGEIGLMQFSIQEKYWMHRHVLRSFQDHYKMGHSVDVGISGEYTINRYLAVDMSIANGEGYKNITQNKSTRYTAGVSFYPTRNWILRVYGDIYNDGEDMRPTLPEGITEQAYDDQKALSLFTGYQNELISAGIEYNRVYNKDFLKKKDFFGYSTYASVKIAPKCRAFARYDLIDSESSASNKASWNSSDGQLLIAGIEFQPVKQLKIAPNIRNMNPVRKKSEQYFFINFEFNL